MKWWIHRRCVEQSVARRAHVCLLEAPTRKTRHPAAKDPRPDARNRIFTPSLDAKNPGRRTRPTVDEDILSEVVAAYPTQAIVLEE